MIRPAPLALAAAILAAASAPAAADVPKVIADTPVVHSLAAQVMAGLGTPDLVLDRGADPHSFQLRPSQARALAAADLVLWVGPELTPWLERAMAGLRPRGSVLALLAAEGTLRRAYGDGSHRHGEHHDHDHDHDHDDGHDHDHGHGHAHGHGHGDGHDHDKDHAHDHAHGEGHGHAGDHADGHGHDHAHDHAHDGTDPHAWLDPANARVWTALIAAELARLDPANAATYAANAAAAVAGIEAIEAEVRARLAPVAGAPIVVFHDAYGYFAARFGLNVAGSIALGDAAAPGAARLAAIRERLAAEKVVCVFPEVQHDRRLAEVVVAGTPARLGAALDPSGSSLEPGPDLYRALMTGLAEAIADCVAEARAP